MATVITRYVVSGISTGAADGTTLADAWPSIQDAVAGLAAAYLSGFVVADVQIDLFISNPDAVNDVTAQINLDSLSDPTRFIRFIQDGDNDYVLTSSTDSVTRLIRGDTSSNDAYFEIQGNGKLDLSRRFLEGSGTNRCCIQFYRSSAIIDGVKGEALSSNSNGAYVAGFIQDSYSASDVKVTNSALRGFGDSAGGRGWVSDSGTKTSHNNVYDNCGDALDLNSGVSRNDIFQNNNNDTINGITDVDYRLTDLATGIGANDVTSTTLSFVDAANMDYHLAAGDTAAIGAGVGPVANADIPTNDVDGDTRSGSTTDIGLDLYSVVASGPTITGPNSIIDGATDAVIVGTDFDTATVELQLSGDDASSISQSITSQDATSINLTEVRSSLTTPTAGVPADGLPFTVLDDSSVGIAPYTLELVVTNSDASEDTHAVTLAADASSQVIQTLISDAVTTTGSVFDTALIAVENNMQAEVDVLCADGTTIVTIDETGVYSLDANVTTSFGVTYYSPSLGQLSVATINVLEVVVEVTAPEQTNASINAAGTQITVNHSEAVTFGAGGNGGLTLSTGQTLSYVSGDGSADLVYSISPAVEDVEEPTLSYAQPTDGIEGLGGDDLVSYSGRAITNNSAVDTIAPVITMIGPSPVVVESGSVDSYVDAGFTAEDNRDGDITNDIELTYQLTNVIGTHFVFANVSDEADNPASQIVRLVNVVAPSGFNYEFATAVAPVGPDYLGYYFNEGTLVAGGQWVFEEFTKEDGHAVSVVLSGRFTIDGEPTQPQTFDFFYVNPDGTVVYPSSSFGNENGTSGKRTMIKSTIKDIAFVSRGVSTKGTIK